MESILEVLSLDNLIFILKGFGLTLYISLIAITLSTLIGTILAVMRNGKNTLLRILASVYIEFVRNVPNLLWIFTIFLVFNSGAYVSETVRAGINAVPKGQLEAAYSLGIRPKNAMRYVILPQAIKNILPALGNEFITIIKDSSLLSAIGVMELWNGATTVSTTTYLPLTPLLFAAFYYLIMTSILTLALKAFENRMGQGDKK